MTPSNDLALGYVNAIWISSGHPGKHDAAASTEAIRWYWWRINAWSEIVAMAAALAFFISVSGFIEQNEHRLAVAGLTIAAWVAATFLTRPEDEQVLERFYRKVRPGGPGSGGGAPRGSTGRRGFPYIGVCARSSSPSWPPAPRWPWRHRSSCPLPWVT
jgi:hypothetical protein